MADDFYSGIYNPDVLSCIANLSNDEVFTPPDVANAMLDLLPQELFASTETTFLDPACKSGVFLREIAKRLLAAHFPGYKEALDAINAKRSAGTALTADDETYLKEFQAGVDHIFHHQLFGIAITELTSLLSRRGIYCSKFPNGEYSVSHFDDAEGNIRFKRIEHRWKDGKCVFCGANQSQYDRDESLESHAYEWIHTTKPEEILKMKFDVIISNPPYQLSDGGAKASAKPIYQLFVNQSKKLKPRFLTMIIPSRWFAGGKGLDEFRASMLNDKRIRRLVDYTNSSECFPSVDIAGGICYFLWDRDNAGKCKVTNILGGNSQTSERPLDEFKTFIRNSEASEIVKKVVADKKPLMDTWVSARKPFGLSTSVEPVKNGDLTLRYNKGMGRFQSSMVTTGTDLINKWKTIISYVSYDHAGQSDKDGTRKVLSVIEVLPPKSICTETYLIAGAFDNETMAQNLKLYLSTKFVRFLVGQVAVSQHITRNCFSFVPVQDFSKSWTDKELYEKYSLTEEEIAFIESTIKPMDAGGDLNA